VTLNFLPWGDNPQFDWDEYNEEEIFRHGVSWVEIEECFEDEYAAIPHNKAKSDPNKYGDRYIIVGRTSGGRRLYIIIQHLEGSFIRPITAWDI